MPDPTKFFVLIRASTRFDISLSCGDPVVETTRTSTSGRLIPNAASDVPLSTEIFIAGKAVRTVAVIGYIFLSLALPPSEVCNVASPPSLLNSDSYIPFTKKIVRYLTRTAIGCASTPLLEGFLGLRPSP